MGMIQRANSNVTTTTSYRNNSPFKLDIHDWRMMHQGRVFIKQYKRSVKGVLISVKDYVHMIPYATIPELMDVNTRGRAAVIEHFHINYLGVGAPFCWNCCGIGKFDWVQRTCAAKRYGPGVAPKYFVRDESCHYAHPEYPNFIFAKVQLAPGEEYCHLCQGFGIMLDARYSIFKRMPKLKKNVVRVEA